MMQIENVSVGINRAVDYLADFLSAEYLHSFIEDYGSGTELDVLVEALNCELPDGIVVLASGDVFAEPDLVDHARGIEWDAFITDTAEAMAAAV